MRKILLIILIFALVLAFVSSCNGENGGEVESRESGPTSEVEVLQGGYIGLDDLVWNVEPTIEAEGIWLCCQHFFLEGENAHVGGENYLAVNHITGEIYEALHGGHGGGADAPLVFDPEAQLFGHPSFCAGAGKGFFGFGMYPIENFRQWRNLGPRAGEAVHWEFTGFRIVERVNSSLRQIDELPDDPNFDWEREWKAENNIEYFWSLTEEAHSGKFAIMNNLEFITDFIYDEIRLAPFIVPEEAGEHGMRQIERKIHGVRIGNNWAVLCINRGQVTDFIFEDLIIICDDTAFAQVNGKWGIVNITESLRANS